MFLSRIFSVSALLIVVLSLGAISSLCVEAFAQQASKRGKEAGSKMIQHNSNLPTTITADTLSLDSPKRFFVYTSNVKVVQGDMTMTCERLEGYYDENNEIIRLKGFENVVIIKGEKIEARSEKAVYEAKTQIATLTENPRIIQGNSALVAEVVKVFLETDKTIAEGQVQMKIVKDPEVPQGQQARNTQAQQQNTRQFGG